MFGTNRTPVAEGVHPPLCENEGIHRLDDPEPPGALPRYGPLRRRCPPSDPLARCNRAADSWRRRLLQTSHPRAGSPPVPLPGAAWSAFVKDQSDVSLLGGARSATSSRPSPGTPVTASRSALPRRVEHARLVERAERRERSVRPPASCLPHLSTRTPARTTTAPALIAGARHADRARWRARQPSHSWRSPASCCAGGRRCRCTRCAVRW